MGCLDFAVQSERKKLNFLLNIYVDTYFEPGKKSIGYENTLSNILCLCQSYYLITVN